MKPKYSCRSIIQFRKDGETLQGRIVEITLFRREIGIEGKSGIGYGLRSLDNTEHVYIGEEQVI
jgi:hypothetical protein